MRMRKQVRLGAMAQPFEWKITLLWASEGSRVCLKLGRGKYLSHCDLQLLFLFWIPGYSCSRELTNRV